MGQFNIELTHDLLLLQRTDRPLSDTCRWCHSVKSKAGTRHQEIFTTKPIWYVPFREQTLPQNLFSSKWIVTSYIVHGTEQMS